MTCPSGYAFLSVPVGPHSLGLPSQSNVISFMSLYPFIPLPSLRIYSTDHTITTVTLSYQIIKFTQLRPGITKKKASVNSSITVFVKIPNHITFKIAVLSGQTSVYRGAGKSLARPD